MSRVDQGLYERGPVVDGVGRDGTATIGLTNDGGGDPSTIGCAEYDDGAVPGGAGGAVPIG